MRQYKVIDNAGWVEIENGEVITVDGNIIKCKKHSMFSTIESECKDTYIRGLSGMTVEPYIDNPMDAFFEEANAHAQRPS